MTSRLLTCAKVFVSAQCQHGERTTNSACCFSLRESFSVIIALRLTSALFLFGTVISLDIYIPSVPYQVVAFFFFLFFFLFFFCRGGGVLLMSLYVIAVKCCTLWLAVSLRSCHCVITIQFGVTAVDCFSSLLSL